MSDAMELPDGCDPIKTPLEGIDKIVNGIGYAHDNDLKNWALATRRLIRKVTPTPKEPK